MLTYALDEYGDFEGVKDDRNPVFIAGLIYDDAGSDDTRTERKRIRAYYEAVITDASDKADNGFSFRYPDALHSNRDRDRNSNVVAYVKEQVRSTLPEYIQKGTYQGKKLYYPNRGGKMSAFDERKGEYHLFAILKSDAGLEKLLSENAGILAKDDYASNLYFHMADELISRLIFYNPVIEKIETVSLDIATRSSGDIDGQSQLAMEYKRLGYKANLSDPDDPDNSKVYFSLTNADTYRSVIAEEIIDAWKPNIKIEEFNVRSIAYRKDAKNMEFLYMADSICSILGYDIRGKSADEALPVITRKTGEISGREDDLIFGYDEIDRIYAKAWAKYKEGDLYKALSITFDASQKTGVFADFYEKRWFRRLEEKIQRNKDISDFNMAVRKLNETLNNNTLDQEKSFYILNVLEKIADRLGSELHSPEARKILYTLNDIGVTAYCHIGDSKNAERYLEKCKECAGLVSLEDYLSTRNKMVVYCCDNFEPERAAELADENITYQELLSDLRKGMENLGVPCDAEEALGKACSQRAQVYAFMREKRAEAEFRKALGYFETDSSNYKITQSYLLHFYLDAGEREAYLAEAESYFGGNRGLSQQLKYMIEEGARQDPLINVKYALYVWVRGLYEFRREEMTEALWTKLERIESIFGKKIGKKDWELTGHPAELIFKYMRLLAIAGGDFNAEKLYAKRMKECLLYHGATEDAIRMFGEIECAEAKGDRETVEKLSIETAAFLREKFAAFHDQEPIKDGEICLQWLRERISFMYR